MAAKPRLNRADLRYILRAVKVRNRYSNKALGKRFGITAHAIRDYINGKTVPLEDWRIRRRDQRVSDDPCDLRGARGPSLLPTDEQRLWK